MSNKSNISILDVRSENEHQNESISGSLNIPLKLINQSINQIDFKSKLKSKVIKTNISIQILV